MKEFHNDWCSEAIDRLRLSWSLDPKTIFLNHGSYGAVPKVVLEAQRKLEDEIERDPVEFMMDAYPVCIGEARQSLAKFVGANPERIAFIRNATEGINALFKSLPLGQNDEVLVSSHGYNACIEAIRHCANMRGFDVKTWQLPWPEPTSKDIEESLLERLSANTKVVVIDHITSPTALRLPIERLILLLQERGIITVVDGAHGPGQEVLDLNELGADYYIGNLHKWLCNPRGTAFLYNRTPEERPIYPVVISHGSSAWVKPRLNHFCEAFDWAGTQNPSAWCTVPETITWFESQKTNEGNSLIESNRQRATAVANHFVEHPLAQTRLAPDQRLAMVLLEIRPEAETFVPTLPNQKSPLQQRLYEEFDIQVPVISIENRTYLRLSIHGYVRERDIEALDRALKKLHQDSRVRHW